MRCDTLREILALEVLHRNVGNVLPHAVIEDLDDVAALELCRGFRLALEARAQLGALLAARIDQLDRAKDVEPGVLGQPNRAHAAASELAYEPEPISDFQALRKLQNV